MEQKGGVMCKRANGRRKAEDEDDEEYIVGEEDVDESESSDDESLVFSSDEEEMELEDEEEEEEEEIEISRSNPKRKSSGGGRKRITEARVSFDEDEENGVSARFRRRKGKVLTYEEEDEQEEDYEDEDFAPDEEEEEGKEVSLISRSKISGKKRKSRISRQKKRGVGREQKKGRNSRRNSTAVKKRRSLDSDTYNSHYTTHDDDDFISKNPTVNDMGRAKGKKGRKKRSVGSESSDSEYVVSEEELRDLRDRRVLNQPRTMRFFTGRKGEEKGKGKEADDSGMQVCGICLSEEQIGTVQGVLDCCAHYFCSSCIMEWSKVESRCPVCKRRFASITKSLRAEIGFRMKKTVVKVQKRDQVYQPSEEEIRGILDPYGNVVCMECQTSEEDYLMLLCDICDSPAHTYCVGLGREVPEGNWYCQCCRSAAEGSSQLQDRMADQ